MKVIAAAIAAVLLSSAARAEEAAGQAPTRWRVGAELDLLPLALSLAAGEPGGAVNVWVGIDRVRLRAVATWIAFPQGFAPDGFSDRRLAVGAGIVDFFFRPDLTGVWIGTGLEYWWNRVGSPAGPGTASWTSGVYTLGGGYVWKVWKELYLNPWAAGHVLLSTPEVTLNGATWTPGRITGEVSLKVGWSFAW
ncbi:MAG TPA: hypothetical protein VE964_08185 [Myxococcales bacterium]|nr:hypothetical protein [Myxococcales bacterium]